MSEFSFDRDIDFLDFTSPKYCNVAINVGLLTLFWWSGYCTFALLIHSFGSVYVAKSYDVCMKTTWKLSLKYPLDVTRMQEMDSRNQNFRGRACPQTALEGRAYGVVCLRHTTCLWHAKAPLTKVWIRPCMSIRTTHTCTPRHNLFRLLKHRSVKKQSRRQDILKHTQEMLQQCSTMHREPRARAEAACHVRSTSPIVGAWSGLILCSTGHPFLVDI